jgi:hypothetical protein
MSSNHIGFIYLIVIMNNDHPSCSTYRMLERQHKQSNIFCSGIAEKIRRSFLATNLDYRLDISCRYGGSSQSSL